VDLNEIVVHGWLLLTESGETRIARLDVDQPFLNLIGLQCQVGSQVADASLYGEAITVDDPLMAEVRARHGVILTELNIVGGQAIPHLSGDQELNPGPPLVAVKNGRSRELVRRETIADLLARDPVYKEPRLIRERAGSGL
jgi:hypothetical protein